MTIAHRRSFGALCASCAALLLTAHASAQSVIAQSTFDKGAQGWEIRTNAADCAIGALVTRTIGYVTVGGNPGGFVEHVDPRESRTGYFRSPSKSAFVGDLSGAYAGVLSYDLKQSDTSTQYDSIDVVLVGGGLTLLYDTPYNPRTGWTPYSVPLRAGAGWRVATCDGAAATEAQLNQALASVEYWLIRCEFRSGADTGAMDNVTIWSPPSAPQSSFDADLERWWVLDSAVPTWHPTAGNPDGCLQASESGTGGSYAFIAPAKFLGSRPELLGKTLELDLRISALVDEFPTEPLVRLASGELEIGFVQRLPTAGDIWRRHAIPLAAGADWYRTSDGMPATAADMEAVLSAIWRITVRGEYRSGPETESLDNVHLGACDPSAVAFPVATQPCRGGELILSVAVGGDAPFTYQWFRNAVPIDLGENPTADDASLDLTPAGRGDNGVYTCVVTNACGAIVSNPATVTICITDFNCDGVVNSTDVSDFINAWFDDQASGAFTADWDDNGVVNSTDVSDFINDWFADTAAGCG